MVSLLCRRSLLPALDSQKTGTPGDIKTLSFMFAENMLCVGILYTLTHGALPEAWDPV